MAAVVSKSVSELSSITSLIVESAPISVSARQQLNRPEAAEGLRLVATPVESGTAIEDRGRP